MQAWDIFDLDAPTWLGSRNGFDLRPTLLRVLTDLYAQRISHTAAEERHYSELALRLLEVVDLATRIAVAKRLARYLSPPPRVLQWLARDLPEVAGELLAQPTRSEGEPIHTLAVDAGAAPLFEASACSPPPERGRSAAEGRRAVEFGGNFADLTPPRRAELVIGPATSGRTRWRADPPLSGEGKGDVCAIDIATAAELNEFFFAASAEERRLILRNLHLVAPIPADCIRVARHPSVGLKLEAAALAHNRRDFVQHLACALHVAREQASRIAADNLGEPVVVAGKVLCLPGDMLWRILMFVNPAVGHSVERVNALAALFDDMSVPAAESMLAMWQALAQSDPALGKHQPLVADTKADWRSASGPAVQRIPAASGRYLDLVHHLSASRASR